MTCGIYRRFENLWFFGGKLMSNSSLVRDDDHYKLKISSITKEHLGLFICINIDRESGFLENYVSFELLEKQYNNKRHTSMDVYDFANITAQSFVPDNSRIQKSEDEPQERITEEIIMNTPATVYNCTNSTLIARIRNDVADNCDESNFQTYAEESLKKERLIRIKSNHEIPVSLCTVSYFYESQTCSKGFLNLERFSSLNSAHLKYSGSLTLSNQECSLLSKKQSTKISLQNGLTVFVNMSHQIFQATPFSFNKVQSEVLNGDVVSHSKGTCRVSEKKIIYLNPDFPKFDRKNDQVITTLNVFIRISKTSMMLNFETMSAYISSLNLNIPLEKANLYGFSKLNVPGTAIATHSKINLDLCNHQTVLPGNLTKLSPNKIYFGAPSLLRYESDLIEESLYLKLEQRTTNICGLQCRRTHIKNIFLCDGAKNLTISKDISDIVSSSISSMSKLEAHTSEAISKLLKHVCLHRSEIIRKILRGSSQTPRLLKETYDLNEPPNSRIKTVTRGSTTYYVPVKMPANPSQACRTKS